MLGKSRGKFMQTPGAVVHPTAKMCTFKFDHCRLYLNERSWMVWHSAMECYRHIHVLQTKVLQDFVSILPVHKLTSTPMSPTLTNTPTPYQGLWMGGRRWGVPMSHVELKKCQCRLSLSLIIPHVTGQI